jgi:hypothetical protein
MKKMFILSMLVGLFFINLCCRKPHSGPTIVEGKVLDETTLRPIEGTTVYLLQQTFGCITCGYGSAGKSAKTDERGYYKIEFEPAENKSYAVTAEYLRYFEGAKNEGVLPNKKNKDVYLHLQPEAYLKLHIKNINNNDMISINNSFFYGGGGGILQVLILIPF